MWAYSLSYISEQRQKCNSLFRSLLVKLYLKKIWYIQEKLSPISLYHLHPLNSQALFKLFFRCAYWLNKNNEFFLSMQKLRSEVERTRIYEKSKELLTLKVSVGLWIRGQGWQGGGISLQCSVWSNRVAPPPQPSRLQCRSRSQLCIEIFKQDWRAWKTKIINQ